jgi:hypothetical protein
MVWLEETALMGARIIIVVVSFTSGYDGAEEEGKAGLPGQERQ